MSSNRLNRKVFIWADIMSKIQCKCIKNWNFYVMKTFTECNAEHLCNITKYVHSTSVVNTIMSKMLSKYVEQWQCNLQSEKALSGKGDDVEETAYKMKKTKLNKKYETVNVTQLNNDSLYDKTTDQCSDKLDIFDISTVYDTPSDNNFDKSTQNIMNNQNHDNTLSELEILKNSDLTPQNIKDLQRKDLDLLPMIIYLEENKLPNLQKEARKLLLQAADYLLINGVLFHSSVKKKSRRASNLDNFQLVVPRLMRNLVLHMCHDSPLGGHSGIKNTIDRVREHYYFSMFSTIVSEYVRTCHKCQIRKTSSVHTKAGIISFPTPSVPFHVWEVDLCGPFPLSSAGHSHIFTAVDMFSKLVFAVPLHNCDALSVCHALFQLFSSYGVCHTLLSDQGSEFISKGTRELCKMLEVSQEFTPSFAHHCLGTCERSHRTLEERMTPYIRKGRPWNDILPAVIFSMNSCTNAATQHSPFEVVYGNRPQFPLSTPHDLDLRDIPKDIHVYLKQMQQKLNTIRKEVQINVEKANAKMVERVNKTTSPLKLSVGDYVYLHDEPTGQGQKLQAKFSGPFIVDNIPSPHLIKIRDPENKRRLRMPVHINRFKMAYIRAPQPQTYLQHVSESQSSNTTVDSSTSSYSEQVPVHSELGTESISSDDNRYHKIKRVLARKIDNNQLKYLVQIVGEPAQNSIWVEESSLSPKAKIVVQNRSPPMIL
ncbi:unnamed protein product [Mytilus coruscus]|uniref:Integrase catalytic domain-containing protein n=1 Tax=Mytilus coruscus TaxID=42192 RepID=A0A6J8DF26_MYTCO|nr:unnamed protein product [Mytilus coruscus]